MMQKPLLTILLLFSLAGSAAAQQAREDFRRDLHLSASNYLAYPGPTQATLTPAPRGYKPFYLSHYGRHGSRYLINPKDYSRPYELLKKADEAGALSPLGRDVLHRVKLMTDEAHLRLGELTELGALQHRQIAQRMAERFPEVFEGDVAIDAKSTVVIRCILSMENELQQLVAVNPRLRIRHDASEHDMYYMNLTDRELFEYRSTPEGEQAFFNYLEKHRNYERAMTALFADTAYVARHVDLWRLNQWLFKLASNLQSSELHKRITLYDIFTDDEIYANWQINNVRWYLEFGACPLTGGKQPYSQRNLLRNIITQADSCLRLERPGATLRFGHETMVMPLTCLLELDNYGLEESDLEKLERRGWLNYRIFPMAANLQFVFYRKAAGRADDVLVKVLLNENEARLPLQSKTAPYYRWAEVRDYYLKKLDAYEKTR